MIGGRPVWVSAGSKIQSWNYYNRTGLNFVPSPESKMTEWKHFPIIKKLPDVTPEPLGKRYKIGKKKQPIRKK